MRMVAETFTFPQAPILTFNFEKDFRDFFNFQIFTSPDEKSRTSSVRRLSIRATNGTIDIGIEPIA